MKRFYRWSAARWVDKERNRILADIAFTFIPYCLFLAASGLLPKQGPWFALRTLFALSGPAWVTLTMIAAEQARQDPAPASFPTAHQALAEARRQAAWYRRLYRFVWG